MAENNKYDILLNELTTMDAQVLVLKNKWRDTQHRNKELEEQTKLLKNENFELLQKISMLDEEIEKFKKKVEEGPAALDDRAGIFNSLNPKERENLKIKLQNLISKIDYHLSA